MTINKDFYGTNFVWWVGEIVDRQNDPLKMGRMKIRIFGLQEKTDEDKLPWAQLLVSPNSPNSFSSLKNGDWVHGFFQDGMNGQMPIITGYYPSISPPTEIVENKKSPAVSSVPSFLSPKSVPEPAPGLVCRAPNEPTFARESRGSIEQTSLEKANEMLEKGCSSVPEVQKALLWVKIQFGEIAQAIRRGIRKLIIALGASDSEGLVSKAIAFLKEIKAGLEKVKEFFDQMKKWIKIFKEVILKVRQFIAWVLSLPSKMIKFIIGCLKSFMGAISDGISSVGDMPDISPEDQAAFTELSDTFKSVQKLAAEDLKDIAYTTSVLQSVGVKINVTPITNFETSISSKITSTISSITTSASQINIPMQLSTLADSATTMTTKSVVNYMRTVTPNSTTIIAQNGFNPANYPSP